MFQRGFFGLWAHMSAITAALDDDTDLHTQIKGDYHLFHEHYQQLKLRLESQQDYTQYEEFGVVAQNILSILVANNFVINFLDKYSYIALLGAARIFAYFLDRTDRIQHYKYEGCKIGFQWLQTMVKFPYQPFIHFHIDCLKFVKELNRTQSLKMKFMITQRWTSILQYLWVIMLKQIKIIQIESIVLIKLMYWRYLCNYCLKQLILKADYVCTVRDVVDSMNWWVKSTQWTGTIQQITIYITAPSNNELNCNGISKVLVPCAQICQSIQLEGFLGLCVDHVAALPSDLIINNLTINSNFGHILFDLGAVQRMTHKITIHTLTLIKFNIYAMFQLLKLLCAMNTNHDLHGIVIHIQDITHMDFLKNILIEHCSTSQLQFHKYFVMGARLNVNFGDLLLNEDNSIRTFLSYLWDERDVLGDCDLWYVCIIDSTEDSNNYGQFYQQFGSDMKLFSMIQHNTFTTNINKLYTVSKDVWIAASFYLIGECIYYNHRNPTTEICFHILCTN